MIGLKILNAPYSLYSTVGTTKATNILNQRNVFKSFRSRPRSTVAFNGKPQKIFFFLSKRFHGSLSLHPPSNKTKPLNGLLRIRKAADVEFQIVDVDD